MSKETFEISVSIQEKFKINFQTIESSLDMVLSIFVLAFLIAEKP